MTTIAIILYVCGIVTDAELRFRGYAQHPLEGADLAAAIVGLFVWPIVSIFDAIKLIQHFKKINKK